ncbi:MAG TPA: hypothetical protein VNM87_01390 [Candidatus Udaeobacter sp.]|nr:hypothetical protein [Candidatus Udaeobacter sp.]
MPRLKDLKRVVRTRMEKTGEAYTAARAHVLKKDAKTRPALSAVPPKAYAELAGMSDAALQEKTGRTWKQWVTVLDRHEAAKMPHRDIARMVNQEYAIDGWWSQTVTVGYERIKGLRARGQRRDGTFEASKSRTYNVPVEVLFEAWADAKVRRRWLGATVRVRTATAPKWLRFNWTDGTLIAVGFTAKGAAKSQVALSHTKLPDRATAERLKQYWAERLALLGELLS